IGSLDGRHLEPRQGWRLRRQPGHHQADEGRYNGRQPGTMLHSGQDQWYRRAAVRDQFSVGDFSTWSMTRTSTDMVRALSEKGQGLSDNLPIQTPANAPLRSRLGMRPANAPLRSRLGMRLLARDHNRPFQLGHFF